VRPELALREAFEQGTGRTDAPGEARLWEVNTGASAPAFEAVILSDLSGI